MNGQFILSTPFSLYNGAVVLQCTDEKLVFGLLHVDDMPLRERLSRAAESFFRGTGTPGQCIFEQVPRETFERLVSLQYGSSGDRKDGVLRHEESTERERHAAVLLLDSLLEQARERKATDIHIEETRVRFRIQGRLETVCDLAHERSRELVRRIKMLSRLDVLAERGDTERQDGQFVFAVAGKSALFVRVSCITALSATGLGVCQSVVLRLLDPARVPFDFAALGFTGEQCEVLESFAALENGLVLLCGSTGAGKSTTAAALLSAINRGAEKKIITIEEPPEYVLSGITQIAVDAQFGMDFDSALRAVFRQDPDVIFIGEIRDEKTARTAFQAAVTGHVVFATMHTGGFSETFVRLEQLGVAPRQCATVLRGIVLQRLSYEKGIVTVHAQIRSGRGMHKLIEEAVV